MEKILPDLIIVWPVHLDFPLWREQLRNNRFRFKKVIVVFTEMNVGSDLTWVLKESMAPDEVTFLKNDPVSGDQDWRNVAVNKALEHSHSEWIFFTEQDFTWKQGFWDVVYEEMENVSYIRAMVGERVHPCCIFLKRIVLEQTGKDFSVIRDVADHFSRIQMELVGKPSFDIPANLWHHMGGLSQNLHIMNEGGTNFHNPEEFEIYLKNI